MIMGKRPRVAQCEVVVRPLGGGLETKLVALVALVTLLVCGSVIFIRNNSALAVEIPDWQVDAFRDLGVQELAVFNALYSAAPEIEAIHEDNGDDWPSIAELADEYLPPFVEDTAWRKNGAYSWTRSVINTRENHIALYLGCSGDAQGAGSFLLVMLHGHVKKEGNVSGASHAPFEVWTHKSSSVDCPKMVTDQALINMGWREVVALKGEDEMRRTKGKDFLQ